VASGRNGEMGAELCLCCGVILVNKIDDSTGSITNAGAKRCDNQWRVHLIICIFFSNLDRVYEGICETFFFCEMDKKERTDLYIFLLQYLLLKC